MFAYEKFFNKSTKKFPRYLRSVKKTQEKDLIHQFEKERRTRRPKGFLRDAPMYAI